MHYKQRTQKNREVLGRNYQNLQNLRYPIGKFSRPTDYSTDFINECIATIEALPQQSRAAVEPLNEAQLNTPYRSEGWTVKQLVHHIADSHMNSYIRFKWTLTEENPTSKAYDEKKWAELKPGVRIISNTFRLPQEKETPIQKVKVGKYLIYVYVKKK